MSDQPAKALEILGRIMADQKHKAKQSATIIHLPFWPEPARAVPNVFLRSALFAAIQPNDRRYIDGEQIAATDGTTIKFKGKQLTQKHLTVWMQLLHLVRSHPHATANDCPTRCEFTAHSFLKTLQLPTGNEQYKRLHDELTDLQANSVEITINGKTYFGSVIGDGVKDEVSRHYVLNINPNIALLLGANHYTLLDWDLRLRLGSKYLALALLDLYASNAKPYPYTVEKLRELTGSNAKSLRHYREKLRTALDTLKAQGFLTSWQIDTADKVHVKKIASLSQQRRINRDRGRVAYISDITKAHRRS
jgi:hypothetical protein